MELFEQLEFVRNDIKSSKNFRGEPARLSATGKFIQVLGRSFLFAFREKEIFTFAALQWVVIALTYYLWVQVLSWIPDEVWESTGDSDSGSIADWVLLAWSFLCVGLAAYPIGVLSGCMGAAHLLHRHGEKSTIGKCLRATLPNSRALWVFHWIDGWITVSQILERLPRKNRPSVQERLLSEALYYAWKVGVAGMLPSLVAGHGLIDSGKNSVKFVAANFLKVAALRTGYSTMCWIVGVATYVAAVYFIFSGDFIDRSAPTYSQVYEIYAWVGIPAMVGVGVVMLFLRPFYILAVCELYFQDAKSRGESLISSKSANTYLDTLVAFAVLAMMILVIYVFRDDLGISEMLSIPYKEG